MRKCECQYWNMEIGEHARLETIAEKSGSIIKIQIVEINYQPNEKTTIALSVEDVEEFIQALREAVEYASYAENPLDTPEPA